jgi:hypothetical protein
MLVNLHRDKHKAAMAELTLAAAAAAEIQVAQVTKLAARVL